MEGENANYSIVRKKGNAEPELTVVGPEAKNGRFDTLWRTSSNVNFGKAVPLKKSLFCLQLLQKK